MPDIDKKIEAAKELISDTEGYRKLYRKGKNISESPGKDALRESAALLLYRNAFGMIVSVLEARDEYTAHHSERVARMAGALCALMRMSPVYAEQVTVTAMVHDIGKVGIHDGILRKEGRLTDEEWEEMKKHAKIGADILYNTGKLDTIADGVYAHHERYNGSGYPRGLRGDGIPQSARIIAVCDSIDAMMSDRPYRPAMSDLRCMEELKSNSGIMYDPDIIALTLENWNDIAGGIYEKSLV